MEVSKLHSISQLYGPAVTAVLSTSFETLEVLSVPQLRVVLDHKLLSILLEPYVFILLPSIKTKKLHKLVSVAEVNKLFYQGQDIYSKY